MTTDLHPHIALRAQLSSDLADRSLPKESRKRLQQILDFVDKVGLTPLPQTLEPVHMTKPNPALHSGQDLAALKSSLVPANKPLPASSFTPFPTE